MNLPIHCLVVSEAGSTAESRIEPIVASLCARGWLAVRPTDAAAASMALIGADTVAAATELLATVPEALRRRTVVIGVDGGFGAQRFFVRPEPGTLWEMLENHRVAALVPRRALDQWKQTASGVIGRRDLMEARNARFMQGPHSASYYVWIETPGADVADFLHSLATTVIDER